MVSDVNFSKDERSVLQIVSNAFFFLNINLSKISFVYFRDLVGKSINS